MRMRRCRSRKAGVTFGERFWLECHQKTAGVPPHDRPRMVEDDLRAIVVERGGDDVLGRPPAEEPPEPDDGAGVALAVAARHADARHAVLEAARFAPAGRCEGVPLPGVEYDP